MGPDKYLLQLLELAKRFKIPTVFWNKEDGIHFDRFIQTAKLFDHIFTVDNNCIEKYRAVIGPNASINTMMFAFQPRLHNFSEFSFQLNRANFVGSYSSKTHLKRREWQDMLFTTAIESKLGLTVVDRNSGKKSINYRYPQLPGIEILPAIEYSNTAQFYKKYLVSLSVNTVTNSETMFSRRLIEILACGGIAVTNPSLSVEKNFKDFCYVVSNGEEATELFSRLRMGPDKKDMERAKAGAQHVINKHTWDHRIHQITQVLGV